MTKKRKVLLSVIGGLALLRAAVPWGLERGVNAALAGSPEMEGRVDDVDLHVLAGRYRLQDLRLSQGTGAARAPLFHVHNIELKLSWKQLLRGALVGEVVIDRPLLSLLVDMREPPAAPPLAKPEVPAEPKASWRQIVRGLFPVKIDRFEVRNGAVRLRDLEGSPEINVLVDEVNVTAENLTNSRKLSESLLAHVDASARVMSHARFRLHMDVDPLAERPTFNVDGELKDLQLRSLNDLFRATAGADVESGKLSVYTEAAAKEGRFEGYVKPFVRELNVLKADEEKQSLGTRIKEGLIETVGQVFDRDEKERSGTRVAFSGSFEDPRVDIWAAAGALFRNAFVKALPPRLEGSVDFKAVED